MTLRDISIWMRLACLKIYANFDPPENPKKAQLQETIVFTCTFVTNDNAHHELPKGIYNPKKDRKIWVIEICGFTGITITQHFCKMTSFA